MNLKMYKKKITKTAKIFIIPTNKIDGYYNPKLVVYLILSLTIYSYCIITYFFKSFHDDGLKFLTKQLGNPSP